MLRSKWTACIAIVIIAGSLLVGVDARAAVPPGMPGRINIAFTTDPAQPVVGQPVTVQMRVFAVGGPLTIALVSSFSLSAVSETTGQTFSAAANALRNGPGGTYAASLTFPSAGIWHLSADSWQGAPGNDLAVTVADAPASNQPTCRASDLTTNVQWDAGAGSRFATITATNIGAALCLLAGYPVVQIENGQGQTVVTASGADGGGFDVGGDLLLQPGQRASAMVRWSNQCPQAMTGDTFTLRVTLPGNGGSFTASATVPPCLGDTQSSRLSQQSFALESDATKVVWNYFDAINSRNYAKAYALFGAQMQANQSLTDFTAGFATTQHDDLHVSAATANGDQTVVTISLAARLTTGDTQRYSGTYTIGNENGTTKIVAASIALA